MNRVKIVVVGLVGPIGAGKTTFLELVATNDPQKFLTRIAQSLSFVREWPIQNTKVVVVPEVPERWQTSDGQSLLTLMQKDPKQYAAKFQTTVLKDRVDSVADAIVAALENLSSTTTHMLVITEGTIDVDSGIYAKNCYDRGYMSENEYGAYMALYKQLKAHWLRDIESTAFKMQIDATVTYGATMFLNVPLETSISQIVTRGRECELALPIAYFKNIYDRHVEFLANKLVAVSVSSIDSWLLDDANDDSK